MSTSSDNPIRVMLVDDHLTMLWGLQQLIDGQRPRMAVVATASNAAEVVETAIVYRPDVVLLDIDLGSCNSLSILPSLISAVKTNVLILTGVRDAAVLDESIVRGARGVVRKEEPTDVLLRAIDKVYQGELWVDRDVAARVFKTLQEKDPRSSTESDRIALLTAREREIISAVFSASGASNKVIAQRLFLSGHTLRNHLTNIYHKLGVENRLGLYIYATEHGLIEEKR